MGADLLVKTLDELAAIIPEKQDNAQASYAPMLKKEDGLVDWNWPAETIHNRVRGLQPWPGAYTMFRGQRLYIWKTRIGFRTLDSGGGAIGRAKAHGGERFRKRAANIRK